MQQIQLKTVTGIALKGNHPINIRSITESMDRSQSLPSQTETFVPTNVNAISLFSSMHSFSPLTNGHKDQRARHTVVGREVNSLDVAHVVEVKLSQAPLAVVGDVAIVEGMAQIVGWSNEEGLDLNMQNTKINVM